ncbi:hypothetical protein A6P54_14735 [Bacillus sp. MKU004]|nr:hypothetical protein A6P54_14735 [Bacillus sp. MKU004]
MYGPIVKTAIVSALSLSAIFSFGIEEKETQATTSKETLSIGISNLPESRNTKQLAKGVTYTDGL